MMRLKRIFLAIAWFFIGLLFPWLVMGPAGAGLESLWAWGAAHLPAAFQRWLQMGWMHAGLFAGFVLLGGLLLKAAQGHLGWGMTGLLTALGYGLVYKAACFLPEISTYPFSLSWSEASRYYYASLYLSEPLYGQHVPLSVLHPTRYLMQAIPFLLPNSPLWLHRAWQVFLWLVTSGLTGWLVARRAASHHTWQVRLALAAGAILFLFQGPVYYHLLVMVILGLWGTKPTRSWRTLVVVLLASLWAGMSRVNWLPVPGLLATALYFLETPFYRNDLSRYDTGKQPKLLLQAERSNEFIRNSKNQRVKLLLQRGMQYLLPPAIWTILGTLTAWASQQTYQALSGNPAAYFGSSFSSDLLWYRLLPNPTYPLGILPSALLVSLPLLGWVALHLRPVWHSYHPLRLLGLGAILAVLFAGGVVVSVKIGGGSNLHNLDAYLVMLLVISSLALFNFQPDIQPANQGAAEKREEDRPRRQLPWLIGLVAAIPLLFAVSPGGIWPQRDVQAAAEDLATLRQATQQAVMNGGRVLLINQRHLLTFGELEGVPLEPDYELVFLMEMAMADNPTYLQAFQNDLQAHRFDLIISEPLSVKYQGRTHSFGEENDAWVTQVSVPVLCNYQPLVSLQEAGVVLYLPGQSTCP